MSRLFSRRLFRTTAFRAAMLYTCAFSLLAAFGMGFIYWSMRTHIFDQIDARLALETEVVLKKNTRLLETVRRLNSEEQRQIFFYLLWDVDGGWTDGRPGGKLNGELNMTEIEAPQPTRSYATLRFDQVFKVSGPQDPRPVRVMLTTLPDNYRLLIGHGLEQEQDLLQHTLTVIVTVGLIIALFALSTSLLLGRRALRRIDQISHAASEFMGGDMTRRVALGESGRDDEFDQLSRRLNAMLERIEELVAGMRQVTDNVAHDLRNPLNRLRNRLEVTLLEARSEDEYRAVIESGIRDADELLKTFNALLSIAQAEAGMKRNRFADVELAPLAEDLADLYQAVAEDADIDFRWRARPGLRVSANRQLLAQAIGNLLDNAVKYTPAGGSIEFTIDAADDAVSIRIADSGAGIPAADRDRVLRRFVRLDGARHRPGNGLGLSLVNAVAKLHGATLALDDNRPGLIAELRFQR